MLRAGALRAFDRVETRVEEIQEISSRLDAACGTGRHAAFLTQAGRDGVIGVDASEAMLARARARLPAVDFRRGELTARPLDDGEVAGSVCALALSHLPEIDAAIAELGRVLRSGGRLVVSNPHPFCGAASSRT